MVNRIISAVDMEAVAVVVTAGMIGVVVAVDIPQPPNGMNAC
jgi:hypothetical protein